MTWFHEHSSNTLRSPIFGFNTCWSFRDSFTALWFGRPIWSMTLTSLKLHRLGSFIGYPPAAVHLLLSKISHLWKRWTLFFETMNGVRNCMKFKIGHLWNLWLVQFGRACYSPWRSWRGRRDRCVSVVFPAWMKNSIGIGTVDANHSAVLRDAASAIWNWVSIEISSS